MFRAALLMIVLLFAAGCSEMEGLRVLTGEDQANGATGGGSAQTIDLVMADKTGGTDPSLIQAAYRIEAANTVQNDPLVDIIEIRRDEARRELYVAMLYLLPLPSGSSPLEQLALELDNFRRAFESVWLGTQDDADGLDTYRIALLEVTSITTLDNGQSIAANVAVETRIDTADAQAYLAGERSLTNFQALVLENKMTYLYSAGFARQPYQGQPNHPLIFPPQTNSAGGGS
jgi:hypothetical protein